ncbi:MAG: hypothetical protein GTN75_15290 [Gemmatimonadetes bacterium]|nr:hypothetical protein [Gemmatimonadota bacterium]
MKVPLTSLVLALLPWAAFGCETPAARRDASTARDSAGVRIVENLRGTWTTPWQVDAEPTLSIGSVDGSPDHLLYQVIGAVRLPGGRIVIANEGSLELLFYDEDGNLLHRVGGRGGGPGEFQSLEWLSRHGPDSVLAVDVWNQRVSYFDADGNFGRSVRLEPNAEIPFPRPVGVFGDGSLLATQGTFSLGGDPPVRVERTLHPLFRYEADGRTAILLGSFPGPEWVIAPVGPVGQWERRRRPFGSETAFAAAGDRFYVGDNATYEIRAYSATGRLIQVMRRAAIPITLEQADIQAFEDSALAVGDARRRRQMRVLFDNLPAPPRTYPAYAPDIQVDGDLNVWVRKSSRAGDQLSEWSVFSAAGELLGTVVMPPGIDVLDIGADYVLGLQRDELGVEYVRKFRLRRDR